MSNSNDLTELFGEVIFSDGGVRQLVEDGVFIHPYPERWPWLVISMNVHQACQPTESDKRTYDQKLVPLLMDVVMAVKADQAQPQTKRKLKDFGDFIQLEHTVADTVWVCMNDAGGLTVYTPSEH